jgi:hypothetical protein
MPPRTSAYFSGKNVKSDRHAAINLGVPLIGTLRESSLLQIRLSVFFVSIRISCQIRVFPKEFPLALSAE